MNVSPLGRAFTAHCEGCQLTAYPDNGAYSIAYGHRGVAEDASCTPEQAETWLTSDLANAAHVVNGMVKVDVTQGQFDALADFVFNEGAGRLAESRLLEKLNGGDDAGACWELYHEDEDGHPHGWIYADGKIKPGLIARRKGEQILWQGGNPLEPHQDF